MGEPNDMSTAGSAEVEKTVLHYLKLRGLTGAAEALEDELRNERETGTEDKGEDTTNLEGAGVRRFAFQQGMEAVNSIGENVLFWGIMEGEPEKVEQSYEMLMKFIGSSLDMCKAELESVAYPVFAHCYLTLVANGFADHARRMMLTWGREHEWRYSQEVEQLHMVTLPDHLLTSEYAQEIRRHKHHVRMSLMAFEFLGAYLANCGLVLITAILNGRVSVLVEDRPPLRTTQVVLCGPPDSIPKASTSFTQQPPLKTVRWGACPAKEVAALKQKEPGAKVTGPLVPLPARPLPPVAAVTLGTSTAALPAASGGAGAAGAEKNSSTTLSEKRPPSVQTSASGAAAAALEAGAAAAVLEAGTRAGVGVGAGASLGGGEVESCSLQPKDVEFPAKTPPLPEHRSEWGEKLLMTMLRPVDESLLEESCRPFETGSQPFVANPLRPNVMLMTFFDTHNTMCCVTPTPDGMQLAAGFDDHSVRVWRTASKAPLSQGALGDRVGGHIAAKVATDGTPSVSGTEGEGGGDKGDRKEVGEDGSDGDMVKLVGHMRQVFGVSWSPDGRLLLSAGGSGSVRLWDLKHGRKGESLACFRGHRCPVWDVTFSPLGYYFATAAADRTACLWSTDCAQPLRIFAGHIKDVTCVRFHPNCNYVVTGGGDKTVRVWDIQTGECVRVLAGHSAGVSCVAVSPRGKHVAAGSDDHDIRLWNLATGKPLALFKGHTDSVMCIGFSTEGSALASGGLDNTVRLWNVHSAIKSGAGGSSTSLGKRSASGGIRGERSHSPLHTFCTRRTPVYSIHFTEKNLVIAAGAFVSRNVGVRYRGSAKEVEGGRSTRDRV